MFLRNLTIIITAFLTLYCSAITLSVLSSCTKTPEVAAPVVVSLADSIAAEKEIIAKLVANINEKVPPHKIVLKSDIDRIAKLMRYLIESAGYDDFEYTFDWKVCKNNHFHTAIVITPKYLNESQIFEIAGRYTYSKNDI